MAAQVVLPGLQVTRCSYSCPGIPVAGQVFLWLPGRLGRLPGIPVAAQVFLRVALGVDADGIASLAVLAGSVDGVEEIFTGHDAQEVLTVWHAGPELSLG